MRLLIEVLLVDTDPEMVAEWRRIFEDRPEVRVEQHGIFDADAAAWVAETKKGTLGAPWTEALGPDVETTLRAQIRQRFGGSLPADHAVCVETGRARPTHLIAVSNTPRNPEGVDDMMRVALAYGAALQAVHRQNAEQTASVTKVALPRLGPASVPYSRRAELAWTAYDLFCEVELPDYMKMRKALSDLLGGLGPHSAPGAYKRSFATRRSGASAKTTLPDRNAAQAQIKRRIAQADRDDGDE